MRVRILTLLLALYVTLDFGSASLPGAFAFDPDESVDAVSGASDSVKAVGPLTTDATGWRRDDVLEHVPTPRSLVRPRVRPIVARTVCSAPPRVDPPPPGDDH